MFIAITANYFVYTTIIVLSLIYSRCGSNNVIDCSQFRGKCYNHIFSKELRIFLSKIGVCSRFFFLLLSTYRCNGLLLVSVFFFILNMILFAIEDHLGHLDS